MQVERRGIGRRPRIEQAAKRISRHHPGHRHGLFGQAGKACGVSVAAADNGLALADEDAQANIQPLGALQLLQLAQAPLHRKTGIFHQQRIGGISTRLARGGDKGGQPVEAVHAKRLSLICASPGTFPAGPSAARVGLPRKIFAATA